MRACCIAARNAHAAYIERIELGVNKETQRVSRGLHNGFSRAVEGGVQDHRHAGLREEMLDDAKEFPARWINRLHPRRTIRMGDGGQLG